MNKDLIYDVGMHNGNDTAYYLACGYRVIAIEADPTLVASAKQRFRADIESKRCVILNVGVAEHNTQAEFWISEVGSHFSSFSRTMAARSGDPHHSIVINCRRLDDIISEWGVPFYLKIDIEGNDIVCCDQITAETMPRFISVEMKQIDLLFKLRDVGYTRFKLINQRDLRPVEISDQVLSVRVLRSLYSLTQFSPEDRRFVLRLRRKAAAEVLRFAMIVGYGPWGRSKPITSCALPEWQFAEGDSGMFGDDLPGKWLDFDQIESIWHRYARECGKAGIELWCDLHATVSARE